MKRKLIGIILACVGLGALLTVLQAWALAQSVRFVEIGVSIPKEDSIAILVRALQTDWGPGTNRFTRAATNAVAVDTSFLIGQRVDVRGGTRRTVRIYDPEDRDDPHILDEFAFGIPFRSMGYQSTRGSIVYSQAAFEVSTGQWDLYYLPLRIHVWGFVLNTLVGAVVAWAGLWLIRSFARLVFRRRARVVLTVAVFATLGVVTTAVLSLLLTTWWSDGGLAMLDRDFPNATKPPPFMVRLFERKQWITPGGAELRSVREDDFGADYVGVYLYVPPESMPLVWGDLNPAHNARSIVERMRSGWPFRAFVAHVWNVEPPEYMREQHIVGGAWVMIVVGQYRGRDREMNRPIAFHPLWFGLVIDTTLYAFLWWIITIGPWQIRQYQRRRHSLCLHCAYDLRGVDHEVCPECGAATTVTKMSRNILVGNIMFQSQTPSGSVRSIAH